MEFSKGTIVGARYRLDREIGEGGMATIWQAEHMTLGSPVAVKFLHTMGPRAKEMVGRFMREARVAASVRHRNVIEITDFGLADDGTTPYMVMELLEGESLADRLDQQRVLDPHFATQIIWLMLRGLAAVHDAGIVHRDLKPENIYLVTDSDGTYPKLLDFGVSREQQDDTKITQEGILVGTPSYMSPEQARGLRDLDLRTDLYSTGVILYELLAGRLPFESENAGDLIVMITRDTPPPLKMFRDDLPAGLYTWLDRAMAKDRDKRFHDAREMRWALAEACKVYGFGADRETGVSRVSEFPGVANNALSAARAARDSRVLPSDSPGVAHAPTEELSLEELASIQTRGPADTPETPEGARTERPPSTRTRLILAAGVLLAAGIGTVVALVMPQSPFAQEQLTVAVLGAQPPPPPVIWEPARQEWPPGLIPEPPSASTEEGVHVYLVGLPDDTTARVGGVGIDGAMAFLPLSEDPYRVEVLREGEPLWIVEHPGDVDGEYEVWPMSEGELEALAPPPPNDDGDAAATPEDVDSETAETAAPAAPAAMATMATMATMARRPGMVRRGMMRQRR